MEDQKEEDEMLDEPTGGFPIRLILEMWYRQCSDAEQIWMQEGLRSRFGIDLADTSGRGTQLKWGHWLDLLEETRKLLLSPNPPALPDAKLMAVHERIVLQGPIGRPAAAGSPKPGSNGPKPSGMPSPGKQKKQLRKRDRGPRGDEPETQNMLEVRRALGLAENRDVVAKIVRDRRNTLWQETKVHFRLKCTSKCTLGSEVHF